MVKLLIEMTKKARITGLGSYLPQKILSNHDLEKMVDTNDEWIVTRTGISERRIAADEQASSDLAIEAAKKALQAAKIEPESVDLILVATMTPDHLCPSTAAIVQSKLGAVNATAFDISAACSGYLFALSTAKAFVESGRYQTVLLVGAEKMSSFLDFTDRTSCILFGDGATAAVIQSEGEGLLIGDVHLGSDGSLEELIKIPAGGARAPASNKTVEAREHFVQVKGRETYKHAVRRMCQVSRHCLEEANLSLSDISYLVAHQANARIIDAVADEMGIPEEKVYKTIHKYGNTSAASVGITLDELLQEKNPEEPLLLVAFGGGLTWGGALLHPIHQEET